MRVLLDTQAILWYLEGDTRLSDRARTVIDDMTNDCLLSIASLWEMAVKVRIGKLTSGSGSPPTATILDDLAQTHIALLPITPAHALRVALLPRGHGDPFDLLIVAQALAEGIAVVGSDMKFDSFGVTRIW